MAERGKWYLPSTWLIGLVRFYQKHISPRKTPCCRFTPSCSAYAVEALQRHGAVFGTALAVWRILRCNPLSAGGYDPVPEKLFVRKNKKQ